MIGAIVDASVAMKWFLTEPDSATARRLMERHGTFLVPDLLFVEAANTVWKRVQRGGLDSEDAKLVLQDLLDGPFEVRPMRELSAAALDLAMETGISVYDASYLALALRHGLPCYTADRKFFTAIRQSAYRDAIAWLDEPPTYVM